MMTAKNVTPVGRRWIVKHSTSSFFPIRSKIEVDEAGSGKAAVRVTFEREGTGWFVDLLTGVLEGSHLNGSFIEADGYKHYLSATAALHKVEGPRKLLTGVVMSWRPETQRAEDAAVGVWVAEDDDVIDPTADPGPTPPGTEV
jgi:hypothetical protein